MRTTSLLVLFSLLFLNVFGQINPADQTCGNEDICVNPVGRFANSQQVSGQGSFLLNPEFGVYDNLNDVYATFQDQDLNVNGITINPYPAGPNNTRQGCIGVGNSSQPATGGFAAYNRQHDYVFEFLFPASAFSLKFYDLGDTNDIPGATQQRVTLVATDSSNNEVARNSFTLLNVGSSIYDGCNNQVPYVQVATPNDALTISKVQVLYTYSTNGVDFVSGLVDGYFAIGNLCYRARTCSLTCPASNTPLLNRVCTDYSNFQSKQIIDKGIDVLAPDFTVSTSGGSTTIGKDSIAFSEDNSLYYTPSPSGGADIPHGCIGSGGFGDANHRHDYTFKFDNYPVCEFNITILDFGDNNGAVNLGAITQFATMFGYDLSGNVVASDSFFTDFANNNTYDACYTGPNAQGQHVFRLVDTTCSLAYVNFEWTYSLNNGRQTTVGTFSDNLFAFNGNCYGYISCQLPPPPPTTPPPPPTTPPPPPTTPPPPPTTPPPPPTTLPLTPEPEGPEPEPEPESPFPPPPPPTTPPPPPTTPPPPPTTPPPPPTTPPPPPATIFNNTASAPGPEDNSGPEDDSSDSNSSDGSSDSDSSSSK